MNVKFSFTTADMHYEAQNKLYTWALKGASGATGM